MTSDLRKLASLAPYLIRSRVSWGVSPQQPVSAFLVFALSALLGGSTDSATCYALRTDPWSGAPFPWHVPGIVRLSIDTTQPGRGALAPDLDRAGARRDGPMPGFPKWERVASQGSADSIVMSWSDGFTGIRLRALIGHDVLRGRAQSFTDVVGAPRATAAVTGFRTRCPASLAG